jgi:competence protein ComEA
VLATLSCGHRTPFKMDRAEPSSSTTEQQPCTNLNTATADELAALPGIGEVIAKRVLDYRERHGRFRRPEEIIIIEGLSERKYRAIADTVCID